MHTRKLSAPYVFVQGKFLENKVILVDKQGTIIAVDEVDHHDPSSIQFVSGAIIPGLVNTHCHLELSHMKATVATGTGLLPFLQSVVKFRNFPDEYIQECITKADAEMTANGIVACGDISNKTDTFRTKAMSAIAYYTFVEMFDFMQPSWYQKTVDQYQQVYEALEPNGKDKKSYAPHAPYTVSAPLFEFINQHIADSETMSIHNQETPHENDMFLDKTGGFLPFYAQFGFSLADFEAIGERSIGYILQHIRPQQKVMFVHNTTTNSADIQRVKDLGINAYWCSCPNANLYIENSLPDYRCFVDAGAKVTLGTDSYTSNWQLNILEEVLTIRKYCSYVPLETLLTWATQNGAEALGYDEKLGTIEPGKTPSLLQINVENKGERFELRDSVVGVL